MHDSSSWTVIPFSTEGQPEDISMMDILTTWLDALLDNLCTQEQVYRNMTMNADMFIISCAGFVMSVTSN